MEIRKVKNSYISILISSQKLKEFISGLSLHAKAVEVATFLNSLAHSQRARRTMWHYYALPRRTIKSLVACTHLTCASTSWCPLSSPLCYMCAFPPARVATPIPSPFEAATTLTLFQLPRKAGYVKFFYPPSRSTTWLQDNSKIRIIRSSLVSNSSAV